MPLNDATFLPVQKIQPLALAAENVLEIKRMVHALDDGGGGIEFGDALAQRGCVAVALGDENRMGAREVRRRFAQRAARQQMLVAERLLAVNQHHIVPAAAQIPVLKPVIEQQRVAAEFFNRVTPAFHPVLVHEHDDVLEIRREHVGLVAGHFGIEQQRFAVGHDAWRRLVLAHENLVQQLTWIGTGLER